MPPAFLRLEAATTEAYAELSDIEENRCVPDSSGDCYHYCPHSHVDKEEGGKLHMSFYLANCVRFARPGELPNCRLVLDWDWKVGVGGYRCMLASIMKTLHPNEWKLGLDYALRSGRC